MIQVDELVIRIPGVAHEQGSVLGKDVAQRVAEALPEGIGKHQIPELRIKLNAPTVNGTTAMSEAIAEQIIRQIKQATL